MSGRQIELSVEAPTPQNFQQEVISHNDPSTAASGQQADAERQQSGSSCSASEVQPRDNKLRKTSSVKSRAAYFEAMTKSPPNQSSNLSPPRHGLPIQRLLRVDLSSSPDGAHTITSPTFTQHQEVEMVDQGSAEANQAAPPLPNLGPSSTHPVIPQQGHAIVSEIQPTQPQSLPMQQTQHAPANSQIYAWGGSLHSPGYGIGSSESSADTSSDDGIELQEQTHVEALEHTIERLKAQLIQKESQSRAAASALTCKTQECESLTGVVRELTENRSKLACARTNLAERLAELQHEYMRLMRVADLSRVVSKENVAKAAKVSRSLQQAEDEAVRQQGLISYFKERNRNLKDENLELRERICLLERLDLLSYTHESVCMREFQLHALKETY